MKSILKIFVPMLALAAGCQSYTWKSAVPSEMRTVSVPTFRNETKVTELGNVVARQVLREFQREGTFRIASVGEAAIEVQGTLVSSGAKTVAHNRRTLQAERELLVTAKVSFIDKRNGKVLVDDRRYEARSTYSPYGDVLTSERDASGRVAEDLARQIVDDILAYKW